MAGATGEATIDFGAFPGANEASVAVTGQATIPSDARCEAWFMGSSTTTDHTANDHRYIARFASLSCGAVVAGTGFTIYANSEQKPQGTFKVQWVWQG